MMERMAPDEVTATARAEMVWIAGATFLMGSNHHYAEEAPAHRVTVDGFWIDRCAVTNRQFAAFARETGYVTVAERPPDPADFPGAPPENLRAGSLVFARTRGPVDLRHLDQWWAWTPGASWRHPEGPDSTLAGRMDHPVVHVAYDDACAYATWAGAALPTEAEWELAARGGLDGATFVWGEEPEAPGQRLANFWHGDFPWRAEPGYGATAAVGTFQPNGYGLHDMAGNVWEWTEDWYASRHPDDAAKPCCIPGNPRGADETASLDPAQPQFRVPRKVLKGGSFLCADSYCLRYRPAARRPQMVDTGMSHVGFRCVRRANEE
jgi:formylglycine-generating enzyme required for sulfatase activity